MIIKPTKKKLIITLLISFILSIFLNSWFSCGGGVFCGFYLDIDFLMPFIIFFAFTFFIIYKIFSFFQGGNIRKKIKWTLMSIATFILLITILVWYNNYPGPKPENYPRDINQVLSLEQALLLVEYNDVPKEDIKIRGKISRLNEDMNSFVFHNEESLEKSNLMFRLLASEEETYEFLSKNPLISDGIIEVELIGRLEYFRSMGSALITTSPDKIIFIKEIKCILREDCFNVEPVEKIPFDEAINKLKNSKICSLDSRDIKLNNSEYNYLGGYWDFPIYPGKGILGCSEICTLFSEEIVYTRDCSQGNKHDYSDYLLTEELIGPERYSSICIENIGKLILPPASEEPIGAKRTDNRGNIWTKFEDSRNVYPMWKILEEDIYGKEVKECNEDGSCTITPTGNIGYKNLHWGDILVDEQPGGISDFSIIKCIEKI